MGMISVIISMHKLKKWQLSLNGLNLTRDQINRHFLVNEYCDPSIFCLVECSITFLKLIPTNFYNVWQNNKYNRQKRWLCQYLLKYNFDFQNTLCLEQVESVWIKNLCLYHETCRYQIVPWTRWSRQVYCCIFSFFFFLSFSKHKLCLKVNSWN